MVWIEVSIITTLPGRRYGGHPAIRQSNVSIAEAFRGGRDRAASERTGQMGKNRGDVGVQRTLCVKWPGLWKIKVQAAGCLNQRIPPGGQSYTSYTSTVNLF